MRVDAEEKLGRAFRFVPGGRMSLRLNGSSALSKIKISSMH
jgi:hypothetical protein